MSSIKKIQKFSKNPFRKDLLEDFQVVKKREYMSSEGDRGVQNLVINGHGSAIGESRFFRYRKYDPEQFTKVFTRRVSAMWDMPKSASRLFSFILSILPKDSDEIYFDTKDALEYTKYSSEASIWAGVKWLLENEFMAKSTKINFYFINPTIFFNGDRAAFVDLIIKDNQIEESKNQLELFKGISS